MRRLARSVGRKEGTIGLDGTEDDDGDTPIGRQAPSVIKGTREDRDKKERGTRKLGEDARLLLDVSTTGCRAARQCVGIGGIFICFGGAITSSSYDFLSAFQLGSSG